MKTVLGGRCKASALSNGKICSVEGFVCVCVCVCVCVWCVCV